MAHFAFLKEIFFGLGDLFTWTFQILPPIGILFNWILSFIILGLLIFWSIRIIGYGSQDKREVDYREPRNFID